MVINPATYICASLVMRICLSIKQHICASIMMRICLSIKTGNRRQSSKQPVHLGKYIPQGGARHVRVQRDRHLAVHRRRGRVDVPQRYQRTRQRGETPLQRQRGRAHRQHRRLSEPTAQRAANARHEHETPRAVCSPAIRRDQVGRRGAGGGPGPEALALRVGHRGGRAGHPPAGLAPMVSASTVVASWGLAVTAADGVHCGNVRR